MSKSHRTSSGEEIIEPMVALAGCSKPDRIVVAGSKGVELLFALHRRGYLGAAASATCGHPNRQYGVALVDWRRRTLTALEKTLDWLAGYLSPTGVLVVWLDAQTPAGQQNLRAALERRGFRIEAGVSHEYGFAMSARRFAMNPLSKAA